MCAKVLTLQGHAIISVCLRILSRFASRMFQPFYLLVQMLGHNAKCIAVVIVKWIQKSSSILGLANLVCPCMGASPAGLIGVRGKG